MVEALIEIIAGAAEIVIEALEHKYLASKYEEWGEKSRKRREERKRRKREKINA